MSYYLSNVVATQGGPHVIPTGVGETTGRQMRWVLWRLGLCFECWRRKRAPKTGTAGMCGLCDICWHRSLAEASRRLSALVPL
jgi:hypothetical protein